MDALTSAEPVGPAADEEDDDDEKEEEEDDAEDDDDCEGAEAEFASAEGSNGVEDALGAGAGVTSIGVECEADDPRGKTGKTGINTRSCHQNRASSCRERTRSNSQCTNEKESGSDDKWERTIQRRHDELVGCG